MTPEQEEHLESIKDSFEEDYDAKFRRGQAEHGGNLFEHSASSLAEDSYNEALDAVGYNLTLIDRLQQAINTLEDDDLPPEERVKQALGILK